jgi:hypothetical protein
MDRTSRKEIREMEWCKRYEGKKEEKNLSGAPEIEFRYHSFSMDTPHLALKRLAAVSFSIIRTMVKCAL